MIKYLFILLSLFFTFTLQAQDEDIIKGDILVKLKKSVKVESFMRNFSTLTNTEIEFNVERRISKAANLWLLHYDYRNLDVENVLTQVRAHKDVLIAQHNHTNVTLRTTTPNDTQFGTQWAHQNTGQSGGVVDADMDTPEAWDISTGGTTTQGDEIVVAIVDGGFQTNHPDLSPNLWVNTDEIAGNGIDDDNNGYIDDINGWDAFGNDGTLPADNHGTHVSGIAGAAGDNNQGVSGINWDVKLMMVAGSSGNEAIVLAAYGYVLDERTLYNNTSGVEGSFVVSTNSSFGVDFGDPASFPLWCAMYDDLGMEGVISAVATANLNIDVDVSGDVPSACISDYMIAVTNTTDDDEKLTGAAFGLTHIDLGAPGTTILSTTTGSNYGNLTGTSMATPQVAGTIGLLVSAACDDFITDYKNDPGTYALDLRDAILDGVDPNTSLNGITVTGGRLNVYNAITELNPGTNGQCTSDFTLTSSQTEVEVCSPTDATYTIDVNSLVNFSDPVTLSVTGQPAGTTVTFSTNPVTPGSNATLTISNTASATAGVYTLDVTGTSTTTPKTLDLVLDIQSSTPGVISLQTPPNAATNVSLATALTWSPAANANTYEIDIATDAAFTAIVETSTVSDTTFIPTNNLVFNTVYYWRVTPSNQCGAGTVSPTYSFTSLSVVYCAASGSNGDEEWIESVEVAGVTNVSGTNAGYADFSNIVIDVELNQSYDFTLTPEWLNTQFDEYWVIWIDYDNDGDFTDAGELVYDAGSANQNVQTGSFAIPSTATIGNVRMRIAMRFNEMPSSCGSFNFGEVEDYTINIMDPAASNCPNDVVETGTYTNGTIEVFESNTFIDSDAIVELGADITYDAANCIELLPNFEIQLGGEFEALIEGCGGVVFLKDDEDKKQE